MSWGTKYRITFKDVEDVTWQVLLQVDGYGGSVTDFTPGPAPLKMTYAGYDKRQTIVGSMATMQVVYESAVDELFVEADRAIRVYVYCPGVFLWWGYMMPFQYFRQMGSSPHYATFMATDQLGVLSDKKFEDAAGDPVYLINTDMAHIQAILTQTGLGLSMREGINIYDTNFDDDPEDSPLTQVYSYPEQYWDEVNNERTDCHTVLTDILKKYGARICQWGLEWWVQRPQTLWSSHTTRQFNASGGYLGTATANQVWNKQDEGGEWRATPEISKIPQAGSVELNAEPTILKNLLKNSTFDYFTQDGDGGVAYYWTQASPITEQDGYLDIGSTTSAASNHYHTTVSTYKTATLRLVVEFKAVWHATNTEAELNFNIFSFVKNSYYTESGWNAVDTNYVYDIYTATGGTSMADYGELSIEIPNADYLPNDAITIEIHDLKVDTTTTDTTVYIRNIRLEAGYQSAVPVSWPYKLDNAVESSLVINETLRQVDADADDYDYFHGIRPYDCIYYLQKSTTAHDNILDWYIIGHNLTVTTPESIQKLLTRQYLEGSYTPVDMIRGTLRGYYNYSKSLQDDDIVDSYGFTKTFIGQELEWDCRRVEWTGTWIEVTPVYTDVTDSYSAVNYSDTDISGASIEVQYQVTGGTDYARTDTYTAVLGEMVRVVITLTDDGSSALPNYAFDGDSGELAWGVNCLEFRCSAGAHYFEINHTDGEIANFTALYAMYSLKGI